MPNRCVICGRSQRAEASTLSFPEDEHIKQKWIKFVNRSDWKWSKTSRICEDHFEPGEFTRHAKKILLSNKNVIPTKLSENQKAVPVSVIPVIKPPRKSPTVRGIYPDQIDEWRKKDIQCFEDLTDKKCPPEFSFRHLGDSVTYYRMIFESGIPVIKESIGITDQLQVTLSFEGIRVPLPDMIRSNPHARIRHFSTLENLPAYIRNRAERLPPSEVLKEVMAYSYYEKRGHPPYSAKTIRFALLIRYTSRQAYSLLLKEIPLLPSFSLLEKLHLGKVDAMKAAKILLDIGRISKDILMMFDEIYLQKQANYQGMIIQNIRSPPTPSKSIGNPLKSVKIRQNPSESVMFRPNTSQSVLRIATDFNGVNSGVGGPLLS